MAQAKLPPFIVWRDGRPRFVPGEGARALGFRGEDLRHDGAAGPRTGVWFNFEEARAWGSAWRGTYRAPVTGSWITA